MEIAIFIVFAALIVGGAILGCYQGQARRKELAAWATQRGWQFRPNRDSDVAERFAAFACLQRGSNRYGYNILEGIAGRQKICAFDYHYETYSTDSKGQRETHHHHFSALVVDVGLPLKPLALRPEGFWDRVGELFGADDIDFESDEFSRKFHVTAADRRWAFDVIQQSTMEFLLAAPRFDIELAGPMAMASRGHVLSTSEFDEALQVIQGIVERLPDYLLREWKEASR